MNGISSVLQNLLVGDPFGKVFPRRPNPRYATADGRTAALEILKRYITELTFKRAGAIGGPPIPFKIAKENIHIEWTDYETFEEYPSIVFLQTQDGIYDPVGLSTLLDEETIDEFGQGTVLQEQAEYIEKFTLEIHASLRPERRAIVAGLERALFPTEQIGIRFRVPDYYNQVVCFTLESRRYDDDADSSRHRRIARMMIEMRYTVVVPVNYVEMRPIVKVNTNVDIDNGVPVVLDAKDSNGATVRP